MRLICLAAWRKQNIAFDTNGVQGKPLTKNRFVVCFESIARQRNEFVRILINDDRPSRENLTIF